MQKHLLSESQDTTAANHTRDEHNHPERNVEFSTKTRVMTESDYLPPFLPHEPSVIGTLSSRHGPHTHSLTHSLTCVWRHSPVLNHLTKPYNQLTALSEDTPLQHNLRCAKFAGNTPETRIL